MSDQNINARAQLFKKIGEFQEKVEAIAKDKTNPFHKSKYADINGIIGAIKPILSECNLCVMQPMNIRRIANGEGKEHLVEVVMCCIMDIDSGESISSEMILPPEKNPQERGKIITYYRRYLLQSLLFLQAEDDDGATAAKKYASKGKAKPKAEKREQSAISNAKPSDFRGPAKFTGGK